MELWLRAYASKTGCPFRYKKPRHLIWHLKYCDVRKQSFQEWNFIRFINTQAINAGELEMGSVSGCIWHTQIFDYQKHTTCGLTPAFSQQIRSGPSEHVLIVRQVFHVYCNNNNVVFCWCSNCLRSTFINHRSIWFWDICVAVEGAFCFSLPNQIVAGWPVCVMCWMYNCLKRQEA